MSKKDTGIVDIHGKQYKTVALRVSEFRETFPIIDGWGIVTSVIHHDEDTVIVRAEVVNPAGMTVGTGHGEEKRSSSNINKTSALENAETSAIGRALAAVGLAGTEYASADEVANAISQQRAEPGQPSEKQKQFLFSLIKRLPKEEQAFYIDKAKGADAAGISKLIEELK